jgi:chromosome segregation protein
MEFEKIQLTGFKSFVERTTFLIEKGLTGIVGPNGCGKSNIVEALRWCMGETSAKSMRGSGMEDVIFSGTTNKPSKNIAEITISLRNPEKDGSIQFKDLERIDVKRKIEKDKGSKYFINEKEVRARDAQTFFADLSTGAHSPSIISQGRIGALVTAKPSDRRAILEEAAGISGMHARRHESELRLNSAENNLKRADELRRQQEKQLENLRKQAEDATKYKTILEEIKKFEAGLYYLKLQNIEKDIKLENEGISESDDEVSGLTIELNHCTELLEKENLKLKPLRDKNIEILSKLQRVNLEIKNLEEQEMRIKGEKNSLIDSEKTLKIDIDREKGIIIDASSNEKRLKEEEKDLIGIETKYYELEKQTSQDLNIATENLKIEQEKLEKTSQELIINSSSKESLEIIKNSLSDLEKCHKFMKEGNIDESSNLINKTMNSLKTLVSKFEDVTNNQILEKLNKLNHKIKISQEIYAVAHSKNQTIKADSIKRQERIKNIDEEIKNWKNLSSNSEKMMNELKTRNEKIAQNLINLEKLPENIAVERGQTLQIIKMTEQEKLKIEEEINKTEIIYEDHNKKLKTVQEKTMLAREKRASASAKAEGLQNRKRDLLEHIENDLKLDESNLFNSSNLFRKDALPETLEQEETLDAIKRERDKLGSVNLRADEEIKQFKMEITKIKKDREDLVSAIIKLKASINELNQKGRERLIEAFEKVNRKFNEVYVKLFNGGNAKLELVDSDDPLEAGLEMLVSPPGKRLQSITLLSGGEQALTALSLIFAVFLTSPAPICILDEVDAPLDDANVTRFCNLLDELIKITRTKFIIVTHHALTMSKMDRLYGVTMPEKGVSQLVAVDLEKAEKLVA